MEDTMMKIMDLADEKFKCNEDVASDSIHIGTHYADDGDGFQWYVWLERATPATIKKFGNTAMDDGLTYEVEGWLSNNADTLEEALEYLLEDLQDAEMKRKGNRLVPVIERTK